MKKMLTLTMMACLLSVGAIADNEALIEQIQNNGDSEHIIVQDNNNNKADVFQEQRASNNAGDNWALIEQEFTDANFEIDQKSDANNTFSYKPNDRTGNNAILSNLPNVRLYGIANLVHLLEQKKSSTANISQDADGYNKAFIEQGEHAEIGGVDNIGSAFNANSAAIQDTNNDNAQGNNVLDVDQGDGSGSVNHNIIGLSQMSTHGNVAEITQRDDSILNVRQEGGQGGNGTRSFKNTIDVYYQKGGETNAWQKAVNENTLEITNAGQKGGVNYFDQTAGNDNYVLIDDQSGGNNTITQDAGNNNTITVNTQSGGSNDFTQDADENNNVLIDSQSGGNNTITQDAGNDNDVLIDGQSGGTNDFDQIAGNDNDVNIYNQSGGDNDVTQNAGNDNTITINKQSGGDTWLEQSAGGDNTFTIDNMTSGDELRFVNSNMNLNSNIPAKQNAGTDNTLTLNLSGNNNSVGLYQEADGGSNIADISQSGEDTALIRQINNSGNTATVNGSIIIQN